MTVLLVVGLLAGALVARLLGGSIHSVFEARIQGEPYLLVTLVAQALLPAVASMAGAPKGLTLVLWLGLATATCLFALVNARWWGMRFLALGIALNIMVIAANAGMPVDTSSLDVNTLARAEAAIAASPLHIGATSDTRIRLAADIIRLPGPSALSGMASIGDLLAAVGVGVFVVEASRVDRSRW